METGRWHIQRGMQDIGYAARKPFDQLELKLDPRPEGASIKMGFTKIDFRESYQWLKKKLREIYVPIWIGDSRRKSFGQACVRSHTLLFGGAPRYLQMRWGRSRGIWELELDKWSCKRLGRICGQRCSLGLVPHRLAQSWATVNSDHPCFYLPWLSVSHRPCVR